MKKKRVNKSKDRDKGKNDEEVTSRSHRSSRRKRKSSSSSNESTVEDDNQGTVEPTIAAAVVGVSRRSSRKCVVSQFQSPSAESENNVGNQRVTRHSKRLAGINVSAVSSDDSKDDSNAANVSVSTAVESCSSPSKVTGKASPYSNESPRKRDTGTPDKHKAKEQDVWKVKSANGAGSGELQKLKICRQRTPEPSLLPSPPPSSQNEVDVKNAPSDSAIESTSSCNDKSDICPPAETQQLPNDDVPVALATETTNESKETVQNICLPPVITETIVSNDEKPLKINENITKPKETELKESLSNVEECSVAVDTMDTAETTQENQCKINKIVDGEDAENTQLSASVPLDLSENVDKVTKSKPTDADENAAQIPVVAQETELEDGSQAEIVLTVDENAIDETGAMIMNIESEDETSKTTSTKAKRIEVEEVYDYERDDTKEEGELSGTEAMSPIHETFENYSVDKRKRSWGLCRKEIISCVVDEIILKERNIKKRLISKEDFDASDPDDLIFVKEIREENIVHEIESEANNSSYVGRDDDDEEDDNDDDDGDDDDDDHKRNDNDKDGSLSKSKSEDILKRRTLESDRIIDKRNKQRSNRDNRSSVGSNGRTVLYITNLVRPFTVNQLRELLLRTGRIVDDGFWIDSIKSKCYVQFETEDEALETRHALHGIRWPVNNPKVLNVQFATLDDLLFAQAQTHESEIPRKSEPLIVSSSNHHDAIVVEQSSQKRVDWKKHFEQYDERPRKVKDVREWDIGKPAHPDDIPFSDAAILAEDNKRNNNEQDSKQSRKDRRRKHDTDDDDLLHKRPRKMAAETQPPAEAKLLDDLYRRTKASPSIYWLPLSDEQIKVKQELKRKRLEDTDKDAKKDRDDNETRRKGRDDRDRRRSRR